MDRARSIFRKATTILSDRAGNFGIMTAIALPVLLASGGVAIDMANMVMMKNKIQDATDAAALAAASALAGQGVSHADAKLLALKFLKVQLSNTQSLDETGKSNAGAGDDGDIATVAQVDITEAATLGNGKTFKVAIAYDHTVALNPMTRLLGKESATVSAVSKAESSTEAKNALSMFLVLDRSGSMGEKTSTIDSDNPTYTYDCSYYSGWKWVSKTCTADNYLTKIAALKLATADLLTQLKTADPTGQLVRMGAVSYNDAMQPQTNLAWGQTAALAYVNALSATGGTDSSQAFKLAYNKIVSSTEETAHKNQNGQVPTKYIVFMTDGENNYYNNKSNNTASDTETKKYCDKARTENIEVYSVAFMAPSRGQALLKYCATSGKHYFPAENASELTSAFKYIGEKASELTSRLTQ
ncbi:pilus assembly protein [Rhizobium sp. 32-5/1]|uniref:vWA domain-containing protein n=1 Tax=Rhizobium sp. 32-5/1 TaxID=3019602 RepID=UPI00240D258F|nr:pilus assembly protein [Rhizobium sp. 32-5/1]WEZ82525.1 pilus assembly protein [Rhizobium sp. 32-5/1]